VRFFIFGNTTADLAFTNSQKLLADAQQKLTSAKGHADAGLENQAKELLAQERAKHTDANAAGLSGQTMVQAEDQLVTMPGGMPFENVSIDSNMEGNAADPLAPKDGSSIISEGAQRETGDEDDGLADEKKINARTQTELDDLAKDPAHGGRIDIKSIAERDVGIGLESQGKVGKLVRDVSGRSEYIDTISGQKWDVKAFNSNFAPKGYNLTDAMSKIKKSIAAGEYVMLDTRNLWEQDLVELRREITLQGLADKVLLWP